MQREDHVWPRQGRPDPRSAVRSVWVVQTPGQGNFLSALCTPTRGPTSPVSAPHGEDTQMKMNHPVGTWGWGAGSLRGGTVARR